MRYWIFCAIAKGYFYIVSLANLASCIPSNEITFSSNIETLAATFLIQFPKLFVYSLHSRHVIYLIFYKN